MRIVNRILAITFFAAFSAFVSLPSLSAQESTVSSGQSIGEFLTPEGRFDLDAARSAGFEGPLDMEGFAPDFDDEGRPVFRTASSASGDNDYWDNSMSSSIPGVNGQVNALAIYDDKLIAGGKFTTAGGVSANHVAEWDGSAWSALGSGLYETVYALTVYDGKLIAAGRAGVDAWDGSEWKYIYDMHDGGINPYDTKTLTVYDGKLIAGGYWIGPERDFYCIAAWDGSSWVNIGDMDMDGVALSTNVYDGKLIIGGYFTYVGDVSANRIAAWDGSEWSPLGEGMNNSVDALTVYDGKLIAGGGFSTAGGVSALGIAMWDGSEWSPLGDIGYGSVYALTVYDNKLIAGGNFIYAGGVSSTNRIAAWDGSVWSALGEGLGYNASGEVAAALVVYDGKLIAGGWFKEASGVPVDCIAVWDGSAWSLLCTDLDGPVHALTMYDGTLIAGGVFSAAGGFSVNNIAAWDGSAWAPLGEGVIGTVKAFAVYDGKLIAGGGFTVAGGIPVNMVAMWDGSEWAPLGEGVTGVSSTYVFALTVYDGKLIAAGYFIKAGGKDANYIASWDGTEWSPLGSGMNGTVSALTVYDGKLIAAGGFTTAGGISTNYIASWDGSEWAPLGSGMSPSINALTVYDGKLIAAGTFMFSGGVGTSLIAAWDGSAWAPLGEGIGYEMVFEVGQTYVKTLTVYDGKLIAGGWFYTAGGGSANNVAAWDGEAWSSLGSGVFGSYYYRMVYALTAYDNTLIAGGSFTTAGGKNAPYIAAWTKKDPVSVSEESSLPAAFQLLQNHPNPFNPSTTIEFSIPDEGQVRLTVYNITGGQVCELVSGRLPAGKHEARWDGKDETGRYVSSGVYIARLTQGHAGASVKLIMIK